jgi:hypothetical protein
MSDNDTSASARSSIVKEGANIDEEPHKQPSVSISVFVCWIVPVLLVATLTRFAVHTGPAFRPPPSRPVPLNLYDAKAKSPASNVSPTNVPTKSPRDNKPRKAPVEMPTVLADKPTGYQEVSLLRDINLGAE